MTTAEVVVLFVAAYTMLFIFGFFIALISPYGQPPTRFEQVAMIPLIPVYMVSRAIGRAWHWFFIERK